jgi:hypothetical protein
LFNLLTKQMGYMFNNYNYDKAQTLSYEGMLKVTLYLILGLNSVQSLFRS